MKKSILIGLIMFFIIENSFSNDLSDSIYYHLYNFEILNGEIKKNDTVNFGLKNLFRIEELVSGSNSECLSVYKFYNKRYSDANSNLIFAYSDSIEILDIRNLNEIIIRLINISERCENLLINEKLVSWIKKINQCNLRSQNYDREIFMQEVYDRYSYFVPFRYLRAQ